MAYCIVHEAQHGVTIKTIGKLESIDESLIRVILKAHSITTREYHYNEVGAVYQFNGFFRKEELPI